MSGSGREKYHSLIGSPIAQIMQAINCGQNRIATHSRSGPSNAHLSNLAHVIASILALASIAFAQYAVPSHTYIPPSGGPPNYPGSVHQNATNFTVNPQPPTPNMGNLTGANTCFVQPDFLNTICRATDIHSTTVNYQTHSFDITDSGGGFDMAWNSNDTFLSVVYNASGTGTVLAFNPATMQTTAAQPGLQMSVGRAWSRVNPNLLRIVPNAGTLLQDYTFDYTRPTVAPMVTTEFDYGTCPGMGHITVTWNSPPTTTAGDTLVVSAFSDLGGQNSGEYIAVYQPSTGGCQIFNTLTGVITGTGYGVSGNATILPFTFTVHDVTVWPGGWIQAASGNICNGCPGNMEFFWQAGTLNVVAASTNFGGHNAGGYTHWLNLSASPRMCTRPFSNPTTCTLFNTVPQSDMPSGPGETHVSWQNVDAAETLPIWLTEVSVPNPVSYGSQISTPFQNEITGWYPTDGSAIRVAHTFTTAYTNFVNFRAKYAITAASQTGKFLAFASDWMGTLGNQDQVTSTCTAGGDLWASNFTYPAGYQMWSQATIHNPGKYVYKVTTPGVSGSLEPTLWNQTVGGTTVDGTATLTNIGLANCRADVFIVRVQ